MSVTAREVQNFADSKILRFIQLCTENHRGSNSTPHIIFTRHPPYHPIQWNVTPARVRESGPAFEATIWAQALDKQYNSTNHGIRSEDSLLSRTKREKRPLTRYLLKELGRRTWPDFVRIMEKHNGVWGGCWCVTFHLKPGRPNLTTSRRELKDRLVHANRSHAALVYDGADIVGWCQFGPPAELPGRMGGVRKLGVAPPDWRITCFFVDRDRRGEGVAEAALAGAIRMIAAKGGGTVDGYPIATKGKPYSSSFLWSGTESMFAMVGFRPLGHLATSKMVMRKVVRSR